MNKVDHPEISVDELTSELRRAIKRGAVNNSNSSINPQEQASENHSTPAMTLSTDELLSSPESATLLTKLEFARPTFNPRDNNEFHVNELLVLNDAAFVRAAYHTILHREPDAHGYNYYLGHLREGLLDKIDVLAGIRFSAEGRRKGVKLQGLAVPNLIKRVRSLPVIGYLFGLGLDILRLPISAASHPIPACAVAAPGSEGGGLH